MSLALVGGLRFDAPDLLHRLERTSDEALDHAGFGVIGFDRGMVVRRYNRSESAWTGLEFETVLGTPMFEEVAPCMNNFLVAQRFMDALDSGQPLDLTMDYVLTLRMRPTPVVLRLIANAKFPLRYVLVLRTSG